MSISQNLLSDRDFRFAGIRDTVRNGLEEGEALPGRNSTALDFMENESETVSLIQWNKAS